MMQVRGRRKKMRSLDNTNEATVHNILYSKKKIVIIPPCQSRHLLVEWNVYRMGSFLRKTT